jgi:predicted DNA-binding protein
MPNAPHKNPQYALRIPTNTMDKLKYIAEYNGRSANKEIEQLILAHIADYEQKHGQISLDSFSPRSRH